MKLKHYIIPVRVKSGEFTGSQIVRICADSVNGLPIIATLEKKVK